LPGAARGVHKYWVVERKTEAHASTWAPEPAARPGMKVSRPGMKAHRPGMKVRRPGMKVRRPGK